MNKYLLFFIAFIYSINSFAQEHKSDTAFINNKQSFRILTKELNPDQVILTIYRNSKIIKIDTLDSEGLLDPKFPDFNKDGNKDIMLTYSGNNSTYDLYLFDQIKNSFQFVEGFDRFPESIQLKTNPKYYYSYHRAGCADYNWVSELFYIENFKSILIGHIYGKGCDNDLKANPPKIEQKQRY